MISDIIREIIFRDYAISQRQKYSPKCHIISLHHLVNIDRSSLEICEEISVRNDDYLHRISESPMDIRRCIVNVSSFRKYCHSWGTEGIFRIYFGFGLKREFRFQISFVKSSSWTMQYRKDGSTHPTCVYYFSSPLVDVDRSSLESCKEIIGAN